MPRSRPLISCPDVGRLSPSLRCSDIEVANGGQGPAPQLADTRVFLIRVRCQ